MLSSGLRATGSLRYRVVDVGNISDFGDCFLKIDCSGSLLLSPLSKHHFELATRPLGIEHKSVRPHTQSWAQTAQPTNQPKSTTPNYRQIPTDSSVFMRTDNRYVMTLVEKLSACDNFRHCCSTCRRRALKTFLSNHLM